MDSQSGVIASAELQVIEDLERSGGIPVPLPFNPKDPHYVVKVTGLS